jgi:beta-lactamase class C
MAVAVIVEGEPHHFNYGVASKSGDAPVNVDTLFEVGSLRKTFTATLAGYAHARGTLSLSEPASNYLPALRGTAFDRISMLQLGIYSAGGLPLPATAAGSSLG